MVFRVSGEARQQNQTYPAPGTKTGRSNQVLSLIYERTDFLPQNQNILIILSLQPDGVDHSYLKLEILSKIRLFIIQ